jgi:hypothetical protein
MRGNALVVRLPVGFEDAHHIFGPERLDGHACLVLRRAIEDVFAQRGCAAR